MKGINCSQLLLRGEVKKALSRTDVRSLEQRARNAHDQSEQTLNILVGCILKVCLKARLEVILSSEELGRLL